MKIRWGGGEWGRARKTGFCRQNLLVVDEKTFRVDYGDHGIEPHEVLGPISERLQSTKCLITRSAPLII